MKNIRDFNFLDKNVLVRCDFNVPIDYRGNILDDFKIRQSLPTIKYLMEAKAKIILISHLGEPNGMVVPELRLDKVAESLSEYLNFPVTMANDCVGPEIESQTKEIESGGILLLENLYFHKEEAEGDLNFAEKLSWMCEVYINDAFSECHKISASVTGIPQYLQSGAGLLLEKEINNLDKVLHGEKPIVVMVGGRAEESILRFIDKISGVADWVMINGLVKGELLKKGILFKYQDKIVGPFGFEDGSEIDAETIKIFQEKIAQAKTVIWYGLMGKLNGDKGSKGDLAIAKAIIKSKLFSVVGGDAATEFLIKQGLSQKFSHVSTGGEAMLGYLSAEDLPGLVALG